MMWMIITIHQPDFLPWLGFYERWRCSDLLILLDDVQFLRRGWHHRDCIKTKDGVDWLTVPTKKKGKFSQLINEVEIDNTHSWRRKHLNSIKSNYGSAPHFKHIFEDLKAIYETGHEKLISLNQALLYWTGRRMRITTPIQLASNYHLKSTGTERIVELCIKSGAKKYLTGLGSKDYLDENRFAAAEIEVIWHFYAHPIYPQLNGAFKKKLSILDYLMMTGGSSDSNE